MNVRIERFLDNLKYVHAIRTQRGSDFTGTAYSGAFIPESEETLDKPEEVRDDNYSGEDAGDMPRLESNQRRR